MSSSLINKVHWFCERVTPTNLTRVECKKRTAFKTCSIACVMNQSAPRQVIHIIGQRRQELKHELLACCVYIQPVQPANICHVCLPWAYSICSEVWIIWTKQLHFIVFWQMLTRLPYVQTLCVTYSNISNNCFVVVSIENRIAVLTFTLVGSSTALF